MGPIDYTTQVLSPVQGYLKGIGFAEDLKTAQLGREQTRQAMGIQAAQEARAAQEFELRRAEAARQQEAARRGQQVLSDLFNNQNPTSDDFMRAYVANPAIREEIKFMQQTQSDGMTKAQLSAAQNIYAAASNGNIPVLERVLTEQRDVLRNFGNDQLAKAADEGLRMIRDNPEAAIQMLRSSTGLTILGLGGDIKKINEAIGVGEGPSAVSPIGKIAQDVEAGLVPQSVLDAQIRVEERAGEEGLTLQQRVAEEARLRGEYSKRTEDLSAAERNFGVIQTSSQDNTGAGDIALVTSFMKMLDPGSVVRETEFATAANAGGLLARLSTIADKVQSGQFLTPQQRTDFQRLAGKYLEAAREQEARVQDSYQRIVDNYGLDPVNVFGARAANAAQPEAQGAQEEPGGDQTTQGPALPQSFATNKGVIEAAKAAGVTPEEMWAVMTPEMRARYGK